MAKHLVLGGGGFIGRHVAAALAQQGEAVTIAGRTQTVALPPGASFAVLDFARQDWEPLLADSDVVHHYVWSSGPQAADANPVADLDANLRGTLRLLEAMRRHPGKRIVFASSGGTVYGRLHTPAAEEDHPLHPISAYGASKVAAEAYLGFYRAQHGVDSRVARIANPFGATTGKRTQGLVQIFLQKALAGEPVTIWGDGSVVRDYLHMSDLADALVLMAQAPFVDSELPVFNIGSGEGRSQKQVIDAIGVLLGKPLDVQYEPGRSYDVPVSVLGIGKARAVLGWSPRLTFEQGLAQTLADFKAAN
jgi:UDP-glucose 4-epimerase